MCCEWALHLCESKENFQVQVLLRQSHSTNELVGDVMGCLLDSSWKQQRFMMMMVVNLKSGALNIYGRAMLVACSADSIDK